MTCLVNTVRIFFADIGMAFGLDKSATLPVKKGNTVCCDGIDLPIQSIRSLSIDSSYKYLGVLEAGGFQHSDIKVMLEMSIKEIAVAAEI